MIRKLIYSFILLFVALAVYEAYAVTIAHHNLSRQFSPYASISPIDLGLNERRQDILVRIQDPTFYKHSGIAWPNPITTTTITQSLVKKLFFKKFTKGFKKIEQTLIARFVVNPNISKQAQLAAFISTAYFGEKNGRQLYGFSEGSKLWFNKSLPELTNDEYLSLIAMLPRPNVLKPNTAASTERVRRIKLVLNDECMYEHVSEIHLDQCL